MTALSGSAESLEVRSLDDAIFGNPGDTSTFEGLRSGGASVETAVIVDVALGDHDALAVRRESVTEGAADLLAHAEMLGVQHLVVVSSAMVYGAYANNPLPITEAAVLRPDPEFVFARQLAAVEGLIEEWRRSRPGRSVTMLRPAIPIASDGTSTLAGALAAAYGYRYGESDPGTQFVHLDDVASAVRIAVEQQLDGVYNVAPDGFIPGDRVRALSGHGMRLPLAERVAEVLLALQWRFQRGPIPPGLRSYTRETWVIANDKLRATGWEPTVTNEQAYVEGTDASWWSMITPQRRQELALGGLAAAIVAAAGVGFSLYRYWRKTRLRGS